MSGSVPFESLHIDLSSALQEDIQSNGDRNANIPVQEEMLLSNSDVDTFDEVIGCLEDIVMSDTFQEIQKNFMDKHFRHFDDNDENKLIYTDIFNEYMSKVESYIDNELKQVLPSFNMQKFLSDLPSRQEDIEQEIFHMLLSFTDFLIFKNMFLEYRREQEGTALDFGDMLLVNGEPATPRQSVSFAQKLGLNFGPISTSMTSQESNLKAHEEGNFPHSKTTIKKDDDNDIEMTPSVQYINGSPVF